MTDIETRLQQCVKILGDYDQCKNDHLGLCDRIYVATTLYQLADELKIHIE